MREATGFNEENHRHLKKQTYGEQTEGGFGRSEVEGGFGRRWLWEKSIICGVHICGFTYSLIFICNTKINTSVLSRSLVDAHRAVKMSVAWWARPNKAETRPRAAFLFQPSYRKQVSFFCTFSAMLLAFLCFLLVTLLFKKSPREVLSSVLSEGRDMFYRENICDW